MKKNLVIRFWLLLVLGMATAGFNSFGQNKLPAQPSPQDIGNKVPKVPDKKAPIKKLPEKGVFDANKGRIDAFNRNSLNCSKFGISILTVTGSSSNAATGSIKASVSGVSANTTVSYRINSGLWQLNDIFNNLAAGTYEIEAIMTLGKDTCLTRITAVVPTNLIKFPLKDFIGKVSDRVRMPKNDPIDTLDIIRPKFKLGQKHQGGIIFYIDYTGEHGLIAAEEDIIKGGVSEFRWDKHGSHVTVGTSYEIGNGQENTTKIIAAYGNAIYAARLCADYDNGSGYHDWFLPNIYEFVEMWMNKDVLGGFSYYERYWTSCEDNGGNEPHEYYGGDPLRRAVGIYFGRDIDDSYSFGSEKYKPHRVRAIRAF